MNELSAALPAAGEPVRFEQHIKPLFRRYDRQAMSFESFHGNFRPVRHCPQEPPKHIGRIQLIVATPRCRRWSDGGWAASAGGSSVSGSDAVAGAADGC